METSDITASISALIALGSLAISICAMRKTNTLAKERFDYDKQRDDQTRADQIINDGIRLCKDNGWRKGTKLLIGKYSSLISNRDEFLKLYDRILKGSNNAVKPAEDMLKIVVSEGLVEPPSWLDS